MKHGGRETPLFGWYEASLPLEERKQRGHFSTPHTLVDQILDACGYSADADLRNLRLLDPACGSGNFLACAARRICEAARGMGLNQKQIAALVQRNLWGLDPDPVACFLAEMQVRSALGMTRGACPALHIHQADSLALSWQPCIDLLVANPPYLAAKNTDLSHYRQTQGRGQADSYLLFLDLALRVVRPGGRIGLVVPDPVLARANAAPERARLLREYTLQYIWHLSGVFAADVGAVVLIAQKVPPRILHRVSWTRARWRPAQRLDQPEWAVQRVGQTLLAHQPGAELRYLLSHAHGRVVERLRRSLDEGSRSPSDNLRLLPLEALVSVKRGEEIGRDSVLLGPLSTLKDGLPVLRGGVDLRAYASSTTGLGIERAALRKPIERYLQPKLLVVKSTGRLQATLDTRNHVVLQTLYLLHVRSQAGDDSKGYQPQAGMGVSSTSVVRTRRGPGEGRPLAGIKVSPPTIFSEGKGGVDTIDIYYFLLALLNSRLLRAYVYHLHTAYKLVQPQIEQAVLARLPVPWGDMDALRAIATRARELEQACDKAGPVVEWDEHLTILYEELECALRALYAAAAPGIFTDKGVAIYD